MKFTVSGTDNQGTITVRNKTIIGLKLSDIRITVSFVSVRNKTIIGLK